MIVPKHEDFKSPGDLSVVRVGVSGPLQLYPIVFQARKWRFAQGVRDMLRISDARMSGASYRACVLHITPESHVGGPLAFVHDGDIIEIDVATRSLTLKISTVELERRRAAWIPPTPHYTRGFGTLYLKHVTQADKGCNFDFLEEGKPMTQRTPEPEIH